MQLLRFSIVQRLRLQLETQFPAKSRNKNRIEFGWIFKSSAVLRELTPHPKVRSAKPWWPSRHCYDRLVTNDFTIEDARAFEVYNKRALIKNAMKELNVFVSPPE